MPSYVLKDLSGNYLEAPGIQQSGSFTTGNWSKNEKKALKFEAYLNARAYQNKWDLFDSMVVEQ